MSVTSNATALTTRCPATTSEGLPCKNQTIPGGKTCKFHGSGTSAARAKAQERIESMFDSAITQVNDLMQQRDHLPTALGAAKTILKHLDPTSGGKKTGGANPEANKVRVGKGWLIGLKAPDGGGVIELAPDIEVIDGDVVVSQQSEEAEDA